MGLDLSQGLEKRVMKVSSKGVKQRVHNVKLEGGAVYVQESLDAKLESDEYAHMDFVSSLQPIKGLHSSR